jgi:hypothetical protein
MEEEIIVNDQTNWDELEYRRKYHREYYLNHKEHRDKQHVICLYKKKILKLEAKLSDSELNRLIQYKIKQWKKRLGQDFMEFEIL